MEQLLLSLGINIASNAIYDFLKTALSENITQNELTDKLESFLKVENARIFAERIIEFAANNGDIEISGTYIYAKESISMKSNSGTKFSFGDGSTSETSKTKIEAGKGAIIQGQGGAQIRQNSDGSISFLT